MGILNTRIPANQDEVTVDSEARLKHIFNDDEAICDALYFCRRRTI